MHIMHGNGGSSWKAKHHESEQYSIFALAPSTRGGISSAAKRIQLRDLDFDILAICETHLQEHLHTPIAEQFSHYNCVFLT